MSGPDDHEDMLSEPERDALLAAEHVLGLLEGDARGRAEQRERDDDAFAAEVADWNRRLGEWLQEIAPETPPPEVWRRLETVIGEASITRSALGRNTGSTRASTTSDRLWRRLWVWQAATGASLALAASLASVVVLRPAPLPPPQAPVTAPALRRAAVLNGEDGKPAFVAILEPDGVQVTALAPLTVAADKALQLWLVPADGVPRSLGLIASARSTSVSLPEALRAHAGTAQALAVSLEAPGGASAGVAEGPLVAQGKLSTS